jgi:hypothetical protein
MGVWAFVLYSTLSDHSHTPKINIGSFLQTVENKDYLYKRIRTEQNYHQRSMRIGLCIFENGLPDIKMLIGNINCTRLRKQKK